jgi:hypothetical protein
VNLEANYYLEVNSKWSGVPKANECFDPTLTNTMVEVASDDDEHDNGLLIYTASEILKIGLHLAGYKRRRIRRAKKKTNLDRFRGHFGSNPNVLAEILEDLQTTEVEEAQVPAEELNIDHFLMAMHHLKRYPTEIEREAMFDISHMWGRDRCWFYIKRVQALKALKILWPDDNFGDDIWAITVDGTHCWIQEPQHPSWSQDREYYSHKYNKAGLNYELGISLWESRLVWMKGPTKAGGNDLSVFMQEGGLKHKLVRTCFWYLYLLSTIPASRHLSRNDFATRLSNELLLSKFLLTDRIHTAALSSLETKQKQHIRLHSIQSTDLLLMLSW